MFNVIRIVRNKAAEKAKHVHHQQQAQQQNSNSTTASQQTQQQPSSVSVITHAPSTQHDRYSINGILGIPQHQDPNGNNIKRKREIDLHHHSGKFCVTIRYEFAMLIPSAR